MKRRRYRPGRPYIAPNISAAVPRPVADGVRVLPIEQRAKWAQVRTEFDPPEKKS